MTQWVPMLGLRPKLYIPFHSIPFLPTHHSPVDSVLSPGSIPVLDPVPLPVLVSPLSLLVIVLVFPVSRSVAVSAVMTGSV